MPSTLSEKTTFSGGELDPSLHARSDLARYQTGVKKLEGFVVMPEGGATRRPGTRFVDKVKVEAQKAKLIPFQASASDNYQLVINGDVMRVARNGGMIETAPGEPYELAVPFTETDLASIRVAQSVDVLFIAWGKRPKVIKRFGHTNWTIEDYQAQRGPVEPQNTDKGRTMTASAATGSVTITSNFDIFLPTHIGSTWGLDEGNLALVAQFKGNETGLAVGDLRRNAGNVYQVVDLNGNTAGDAGPNLPTHTDGDVRAGVNNVTWRFRYAGGGFFRVTGFTNARQVTADVISELPVSAVGSHTSYRWSEPSWSDDKGWPDQVLLQSNRLIWARKNRLWMTKLGDYYDFEVTDLDDSALATLLTSRDGKLVDTEWIADCGVLVVGTSNSEWTVRGTDAFGQISVTNIRAVAVGTDGSSPQTPQLVDDGIIFIGRSRRRLHFATFDPLAEKIETDEITKYSRRIIPSGAIATAYQRDPYRVLWVAEENGRLSSLTFYLKEQVLGWARHPLVNGAVEDLSVIPSEDGAISELWLVVRRTIGGETRRYIEVMRPYFEPLNPDQPTAEGAWFVDSGLSYSGPPVTHVTGLAHLEGEEVSVLANGIEHRPVLVEEGAVDLDRPAGEIVVGLPTRYRLRTLPTDANLQDGSSRGKMKRATHVLFERLYSTGGFISVNDAQEEPVLLSGSRALSTPQPLHSDPVEVVTLAHMERWLEIELTGEDVYPQTVLGLSPTANFEEG